jgi:hypothetical protein
MAQPIHKDKWEYVLSRETMRKWYLFFINDLISPDNNKKKCTNLRNLWIIITFI